MVIKSPSKLRGKSTQIPNQKISTTRRKKKNQKSAIVDLITQIALYNTSSRAAPIPAFELEFKFCDWRRFRADMAWLDLMILLEVEGGTSNPTESRHTTAKGYETDCLKYSIAACLGYRMVRVTTNQVKSGLALALILNILELESDLPQHTAK